MVRARTQSSAGQLERFWRRNGESARRVCPVVGGRGGSDTENGGTGWSEGEAEDCPGQALPRSCWCWIQSEIPHEQCARNRGRKAARLIATMDHTQRGYRQGDID